MPGSLLYASANHTPIVSYLATFGLLFLAELEIYQEKGVQGFSPAGVQGASPCFPPFPKKVR